MNLNRIVKGLPPTDRLYWRDAYLQNFDAQLLRVAREGRNAYLLLDATLFHPKGGGQPSDQGLLYNPQFKVRVKKVMQRGGHIIHYGQVEGEPTEGVKLQGRLDWGWRYLLMRRHTAGHLLDYCLGTVTERRAQPVDSWVGDPCYVSFTGPPPTEAEVAKIVKLENSLIDEGAEVVVGFLSHREALKRIQESPNIHPLPEVESMRVVTIAGCGSIPCGGTHVRNLRELGGFRILKVEPGESTFKIYYDLPESP